MSFGPDGRLYVSEDVGSVVSVTRGSTIARPFRSGLATPLGLLWRGRTLYVSETGRVDALRAGGAKRVVLSGLPYGRHQQDAIVVGPDGRLYLGSGSTCDACKEKNARSATILSFRTDGSDVRIVARGLRNPYGLVFVGRTLYATVNGRDDLGDGEPAEMVVHVQPGRATSAGPFCWPSFALERLTGSCAGVSKPPRLSRTAFVGRRDRLLARRPVRDRVGRVPLAGVTGACSFASGVVTRRAFASGFDHPLALAVDPSRRPAGRRLGSRRDLRDREDLDRLQRASPMRVSVWPFGSFAIT